MNVNEALIQWKNVTVDIQLQMSWKKTVSSKSCCSRVLLFKKDTTASSKMYAFLTNRRREKKRSAMYLLFVPTRRSLGGRWNWPVNLVPVGTFRKHGRHNIRFIPLSGHIITNMHTLSMCSRIIIIVYVKQCGNTMCQSTVSKGNMCFSSLSSN